MIKNAISWKTGKRPFLRCFQEAKHWKRGQLASLVRVNGKLGQPFHIQVGIHQGSVLSPLHFIIVLEALLKAILYPYWKPMRPSLRWWSCDCQWQFSWLATQVWCMEKWYGRQRTASFKGGHHIVFNIWRFCHVYWDYNFISYPNCPSEVSKQSVAHLEENCKIKFLKFYSNLQVFKPQNPVTPQNAGRSSKFFPKKNYKF